MSMLAFCNWPYCSRMSCQLPPVTYAEQDVPNALRQSRLPARQLDGLSPTSALKARLKEATSV